MMPIRQVSALFVSRRSIYKHMDGVDAFDRSRDARANFTGLTPVIEHVPCRCWSLYLSGHAKPQDRKAEMELGIWAVETVMRCGGVLEQPAHSKLWKACQLPRPGDYTDPFCYTVYLEQSWFGFPTPKPTWVLVCGVPRANLPALPQRTMPSRQADFQKLNAFQRSRTMKSFADWLCQTARATWWRPDHANWPGRTPCQLAGRKPFYPHVRTADTLIKTPHIQS